MANIENLVSLADRTTEEKRAIAIKGGKASGEARREKATFKKMLDKVLDEKTEDGETTYREKITMGQIKSAIDGKAENFKLILQVMGELEQSEEQETRPVQIIIKDNTNLEKVMYEDSD